MFTPGSALRSTALYLSLLSSTFLCHVSAFEANPRWGQATAVINDALFVYGGKTDVFNQFSYTGAPNINDILFLSLSAPFSGDSPPWDLVSSSTNTSTSQGPALAWATICAFNTSEILLFGGQPDSNSDIVVVDSDDSAELLNVFSRLDPLWVSEPSGWVGEPVRRIRHSAATSTTGLVFIVGGEKADGSNALSDHFYFDPNAPSFTLLPTSNAPPDIFGHVSIILSDGRILVFGGFCQSQGELLPFSTIWILDTKTLTWSVITTATASLPSPRMAFAAVLIAGGKIIIHGGSADLQVNFEDGWILDTTQTPMTWSQVEALSQLGPRRDHFAVSSGEQVIFGFGTFFYLIFIVLSSHLLPGYNNSAPASSGLQIYNPSSGTFTPTFTPPAPTASFTQTLPLPSQTTDLNTPTASFSSTNGVHPTSTVNPNDPGGSSGNGGGTGTPNSGDNGSNKTTAIAVGTSFGVLSLIVIALGAAYYVRKKRREREGDSQFMALGGDDDDGSDSPHLVGQIPALDMHESEPHGTRRLLQTLGIAGALGAAARMRSVRNSNYQRRDMLADEDTRSFGEWYNARQKEGAGDSSWSLVSILSGARNRLRSRNASVTSHGAGGYATPWREKSDPFSDGASVMRDEETGFIGAAAAGSRPQARREMSYASYASSNSGPSYRDPFVDSIQEERRHEFQPADLYTDNPIEGEITAFDPNRPTIRPVPPITPIRTTAMLPLSQLVGHPLSPLSEHTSQSTLGMPNFSSSGSSQAHSNENIISPFAGSSPSRATSMTSFNRGPTPGSPATTSIVGAADPVILSNNQPMRRSDSWWHRFSRTSLLDRRGSDASRRSRYDTRYDIRDPNPAPRLGAIEEASLRSGPATEKSSPGSAGEQDKQLSIPRVSPPKQQALSRANSASAKIHGGHGKSMSSLRTADSEAIEKLASAMDVVQRVKSRSRWGSGSTSSAGGMSIDSHGGSVSESGEAGTSRRGSLNGSIPETQLMADDFMMFASPVDQEVKTSQEAIRRLPSPPPVEDRKATVTSSATLSHSQRGPSTRVSDRIQAYERRMSQEQPSSPPATNTKQKEERSKKRVEVAYGMVPKPSLFVANPDHRSASDGS